MKTFGIVLLAVLVGHAAYDYLRSLLTRAESSDVPTPTEAQGSLTLGDIADAEATLHDPNAPLAERQRAADVLSAPEVQALSDRMEPIARAMREAQRGWRERTTDDEGGEE